MAKPDLVRHINQARALRLLKEHGTLSRAELARFLNLNRSTLTFVTGELLQRKLIREAGEPFVTQATGRPGTGLKLNPEGAYFFGAEIGAERVHLVLIDLEGSIRHRQTAKLRSSEPSDVSSVLVHLVRSVSRLSREWTRMNANKNLTEDGYWPSTTPVTLSSVYLR